MDLKRIVWVDSLPGVFNSLKVLPSESVAVTVEGGVMVVVCASQRCVEAACGVTSAQPDINGPWRAWCGPKKQTPRRTFNLSCAAVQQEAGQVALQHFA